MAARFLQEEGGIALTEALIAMPIVLGVLFVTVDVTTMLYEWNLANKATYVGAREAVISQPAARNTTNFSYENNPTAIGNTCFSPTTGAVDNSVNCPTVATRCIGGESACTQGQELDQAAFDRVFGAMEQVYPRLRPHNIAIDYRTNGLGFFGQPGGLPMEVTVSIRCMRTHLFFLGFTLDWIALPQGCPGTNFQGPPMPRFSSTLPSEAMEL